VLHEGVLHEQLALADSHALERPALANADPDESARRVGGPEIKLGYVRLRAALDFNEVDVATRR
jgi:hypothetical protein